MGISFVVLGSTLALLAVFVLLLRRTGRLSLPSGSTAPRRMERLDQLAIGPGERLVLVKVLDEVLLVGVAPQQVSMVHRFGPVDPGWLAATGTPSGPGFSAVLQQVLDGYRGRRP